jgi:hypothetical protein
VIPIGKSSLSLIGSRWTMRVSVTMRCPDPTTFPYTFERMSEVVEAFFVRLITIRTWSAGRPAARLLS